MKRFKKFSQILISLTLILVLIGWIFVIFNWIPKDFYIITISVIGTAASVSALLDMLRNKELGTEIENLNPVIISKIAQNQETLYNLKLKLDDTTRELSNKEKSLLELEIKRNEMEMLIRKASMIIFLKDQLEHIDKKLKEILDSNQDIRTLLINRQNIVNKLYELKETVANDENFKIIEEITSKSNFTDSVYDPDIFSSKIILAMHKWFNS